MFRFTIRDVLWLTVVVGMGAGRWTVAELIERAACYDSPQPPTAFDRFIDSLPDA